ncbi:MAG: beta strand repeat-containing protein, partial [Pseudomonas sp.]
MAASTYFAQVQQLYIAYFGRPADPTGQAFWAANIDAAHGDISAVIAGFSASNESNALFGNKSSIDKVTAIYENAFGRAPEPAGLAYWVAKLDSGTVSQAQASWTIQQSAGPGDAAAVQNKLVAAQAFTAQIDTTAEIQGYQGAAAADSGRAFLATVTQDPATANAAVAGAAAAVTAAAVGVAGTTFALTAGADTIVGTANNDVINALSINAAGADASTLTGFDSIDGGAGNDTLNIFTKNGFNDGAFPSNVTVKNVETINYNNTNAGVAIDASNFVGATAINQIGLNAAAVTNLAAGTVAGFNGTTGGTLSVTAADAAATAAVGLTNVAEGQTFAVAGTATGVLNSVTVTGNVVDTNANGTVANTTVAVTVGKDVESLAVNTAVATTLTVTDGAGTKKVSTVDASASTGAVTYVGAATVANIKTGTGNDTATLATSLNATVKAASISTGAGNDTITVSAVVGTAAAGQTVTVDAGEGNDTISLTTIAAGVGYNVAAGAGDDTVVITGTVKTTDKIDGGAGTDTVSLAPVAATLVADDYIVFNKVLTNFETLKLTSVVSNLDASQLAATYTTVDLATGSKVINVGTQALVANGDLTATANGTDVSATPKVYAGTLNIADKATGTITAYADKVALTVDASANAAAVALAGGAQSASVTLIQALNTAKTAYVGAAAFTLDNSAADASLGSVTLSGNGTASIVNADTTKLVSVDASALNSVTFDGKAANGLTYTSTNSLAETIKLGAGIDNITLGASTYGKVDVVSGL